MKWLRLYYGKTTLSLGSGVIFSIGFDNQDRLFRPHTRHYFLYVRSGNTVWPLFSAKEGDYLKEVKSKIDAFLVDPLQENSILDMKDLHDDQIEQFYGRNYEIEQFYV
jgi:hypothetical protein